jgi:hypothetical protein
MARCIGWGAALAAVVLGFLLSIYLMAGVRWQGDNPHHLTVSGAVAHSDTTYGVSLGLAAVVAGLLLALEATCRIPLARASLPVVALLGASLLVAIGVTWRRHRAVHHAFTALTVLLMVAAAGLWTHAAGRGTMQAVLAVLTVLLFLAGVGVGGAGRCRRFRWVAVLEWLIAVLFLSAVFCSCAGRLT